MSKSRFIALAFIIGGLAVMPGVFVFAFLVTGLGLSCSESVCIPVLVNLFWGGLLLFFVGFGFLQFIHFSGWWKRRKEVVEGFMRCRVCQEEIPRSNDSIGKIPHYTSVHPQYARWFLHIFRRIFAVLIPSIFVLVVVDLLAFGSGGIYVYIAIITNILFLVLLPYSIGWMVIIRPRQFVREWKQNHPTMN